MNWKPDHITLNGRTEGIENLLQEQKTVTNWEKDFYSFLKEWYSEEDFITVQTSGSTGKPKNIRLKKDFVATSALRTIQYFHLKENARVLHCLPTKYIAGKLMLVRTLIGNLNLVLMDPAGDFRFLENESFDFAAMVPTQVAKLFEIQSWNIKHLLIGGDAISTNLEKQLQKVSTACYSSYGMTETATHIAIRKLNGSDAAPYYHCLPNIKITLSENKCLQIDMPGLDTSPLCTTDIAEIIDNRTFRILGRADNIIISGGIKFSPENIEKKLAGKIKFPFMISSESHEELGKQMIILIEKAPNAEYERELQNIFNSCLEKFERPRRISYLRQLPRTTNGKLKRN